MGKVMASSLFHLEGEQKYLRIQQFYAFKSKIQRTRNSYLLKPLRVIWPCWQLHFLLHCGEWILGKRLLKSLNSLPAGAGQTLSQCQSKGSRLFLFDGSDCSRLGSGASPTVKSCWVGLGCEPWALTRKCSQWGMYEACLTSVWCDQGILWERVIWVQKYSYLINLQGFSRTNKRPLLSVNTIQQERKFGISVFSVD